MAANAIEPGRVDARVEATARDWLAGEADAKGLSEPVFEVKATAARPQPLPICAQPLSVDALDTRTLARLRFAVVCPEPDGWQREWVVRAAVSAMVVVATRDVPANQALAHEDLSIERRRLTDLANAVSVPEDAVGQSSSRTLRSGQPLQARWLAAPLLVRRGDSVTIVAGQGGIQVQAAGEALEAGRLRQVVRVRNSTSGRLIRARVIDHGVVEPEGMASTGRP
jgi:flagella basal body P-ring formation protein FlgA